MQKHKRGKRVTDAEVKEVLALLDRGKSKSAVARETGVSRSKVYRLWSDKLARDADEQAIQQREEEDRKKPCLQHVFILESVIEDSPSKTAATSRTEKIIEIKHLDEAENKIESDKIINAVVSQPKQFQAVLYSILLLTPKRKVIYTGEIYDVYKTLCEKIRFNVLTQRRISDILAEYDMLGIINAKIVSKGRYGRTREVSMALEDNIKMKCIFRQQLVN